MKKYFYALFLLFSITIFGFIYRTTSQKKEEIPSLKERNINIGLQSEWLNTKAAIASLLERIKANPKDNKAKLELAMGYIQESRVTGDHDYYDEAALKLLNQVIAEEANNFDALCAKATVLLSQHHFQDGADFAHKALIINPNNAFVYGILCDANLELGDYDMAIKMADKMVSIRPDIRSYARISYLREIFGDYKGAIEAMQLATKSAYPGLEQSEWTRCQLGKLYETTGDTAKAAQHYKESLIYRENYPYALVGLGRLAQAKKEYSAAIRYVEQAQKAVQDYSFGEQLIDLYKLNGENQKADEMTQNVITLLQKHANTDEKNPEKGHYADKELAYLYLKANEPEKALESALREYNRRPENIETNEALAWCYYKNNDLVSAKKHIAKALRYNSLNPALLAKAKMIQAS
jgi:tetratricopeptide (TPR) repeat protein